MSFMDRQQMRRRDNPSAGAINSTNNLNPDEDLEKQQQQQQPPGEEERLRLRIKSSRDVELYTRHTDTVADLKTAVLEALGKYSTSPQQPYVRLIAAGRLLAPDTAILLEFKLQNDSVIHAVVSSKRGAQAAAAQSRSLRGSGIDTHGRAVRRRDNSADDDDDDDDDDIETGTRRLGFDRLRDAAGFRRSEVATIRGYFSRSVDRWIRDNPAAAELAASSEIDPTRRRLRQEEAWIESQGPASEFRLNMGSTLDWGGGATGTNTNNRTEAVVWRSAGMSSSVGTDRDFVWGFIMGFCVGLIMLLWVWIPTVPHKQKLGILTGISAQLALSMLHGAERAGIDDLVLTDY